MEPELKNGLAPADDKLRADRPSPRDFCTRWREVMSANRFVLKHHHVEIDYTIGITPGLTALTYKNGSEIKTFKTNEITTEPTALGSLVSVALARTIDSGGERLGFFLPNLDVPMGQSEKFTTVGVYDKFSGPNAIPRRPPAWSSIELHGTAETVIVPLAEGLSA
jgi:hypothetical protein